MYNKSTKVSKELYQVRQKGTETSEKVMRLLDSQPLGAGSRLRLLSYKTDDQ